MTKRYRFAFDENRIYAGLTWDPHIVNATEHEPIWVEGFLPRFNPEKKNWDLLTHVEVQALRDTSFVVQEFRAVVETVVSENLQRLLEFEQDLNRRNELWYRDLVQYLKLQAEPVNDLFELQRKLSAQSNELIQKQIVALEVLLSREIAVSGLKILNEIGKKEPSLWSRAWQFVLRFVR